MISPRSGALLVSLGASLTLTACVSQGSSGGGSIISISSSSGYSGGSAAAGGSVTIGVVMATTPKSGFMGPIDSPALNAMKIEADTLNAAGGIGGQQVKLDIVDTNSTGSAYGPAATKVIADGAKVVVVSCDYDTSLPAAQVAQSKGLLNIAPCVGDPIYGPAGGLPLGFSMGDGTPGEASIMAEFSASKGWKKAVLLTDTTLKYTQNECTIFAKRFKELGGSVVQNYNYKQGDSVTETVSKIASGAKPDVVANCGYNPGGATVAKQLRAGGVAAPIISGFGMDGDFWTSQIPGLSDYYVVTYAAKNGDDPNPAVNDMLKKLTAAGAAPATGGFVTGPATLEAIKAGYDQAKSWDGAKLTAAFESFQNIPTLAGPTSFSKDLHINVKRPMRVLKVVNGKLTFVVQQAAKQVDNAS